TVNVTITDEDGDTVTGTTTVDTDGNWTFTTTNPLPDGSYTAGATQTTAGGTSNGSNEVDFDVERDTNRPEPPTVDVTVEDDYSVTASGTGEPGATVNVVIRDEDGEDVANGEVIVDEDGNWTFTTTGPLPDGDYTASVNQTVDGSTSEDAEEDFTVERDPGNGGQIVFTIASPTNGQSFVVGNSVVVQGTGHPGASVLVRINQQTGGALVVQHNITVGANGNWTTTFGGLAISNYVAVATQTVGDDEFGPLSRNFSIVASNNNNNNNNNNTWNPNRPGGGGPTFIGGGTTPANENLLFVVGFPDGDFRPDAPITRAEIAAMGSRIHFTQIGQNDANFPDIAGYEWFSNYVGFTQRRGMMEGYPTGNFEPNQNMTRAEFATMIARFIGLSPYGTSSERHSDVSGHWSEGYINALTIARPESINGFPDGTFRPDATITRAEAVSIINRVLGRRVDTEGLTNVDHLRFQDSTGHWAYYYIVKASNSHSYQRNLSGNRANWTRVWQDIWWRS
ncbi:MAG: S-layer homology domain-containing protein, partial [Oscillospiraceae bacterium]|nr:S-layer homology domain-containing protein [Oscillospiraceae bacterium]